MQHFQNYVEFKEFNPYAEKDAEFERAKTPH